MSQTIQDFDSFRCFGSQNSEQKYVCAAEDSSNIDCKQCLHFKTKCVFMHLFRETYFSRKFEIRNISMHHREKEIKKQISKENISILWNTYVLKYWGRQIKIKCGQWRLTDWTNGWLLAHESFFLRGAQLCTLKRVVICTMSMGMDYNFQIRYMYVFVAMRKWMKVKTCSGSKYKCKSHFL